MKRMHANGRGQERAHEDESLRGCRQMTSKHNEAHRTTETKVQSTPEQTRAPHKCRAREREATQAQSTQLKREAHTCSHTPAKNSRYAHSYRRMLQVRVVEAQVQAQTREMKRIGGNWGERKGPCRMGRIGK